MQNAKLKMQNQGIFHLTTESSLSILHFAFCILHCLPHLRSPLPDRTSPNYSISARILNCGWRVMLLAMCHRCWTWMEPKHERCVECGQSVNLQEPDPDDSALGELFGDALLVIAEVTLSRPKLPTSGLLAAYAGGLLFLPDVRTLPTGGLVAAPSVSAAGKLRNGFWSLFAQRPATKSEEAAVTERPLLSTAVAATSFLETPGALFVRRESIRRLQLRGDVFRVERHPGRTLAFRVEAPLPDLVDQLQRLKATTGWSGVNVIGV